MTAAVAPTFWAPLQLPPLGEGVGTASPDPALRLSCLPAAGLQQLPRSRRYGRGAAAATSGGSRREPPPQPPFPVASCVSCCGPTFWAPLQLPPLGEGVGTASPDPALRLSCLPAAGLQQLPRSRRYGRGAAAAASGGSRREPPPQPPFPVASCDSCCGPHILGPAAAATARGRSRYGVAGSSSPPKLPPRRRAPAAAAVSSLRPRSSCCRLGRQPSRAAAAATLPRR